MPFFSIPCLHIELDINKELMVIDPATTEIIGFGGGPVPLDAIELSKRADAINRRI